MLKADETIEEYKILSYLTELIFEKISQIKLNIEILSEYDMVFAKAKYSQKIKGITPKINNNGYIKIIKGKHPLLTGDAVPLDFEIGKNYRSLIITGPNAGGKTVTLKTVGLLTLMVQCGFDISAKEGSEFSVFEKVFVDISLLEEFYKMGCITIASTHYGEIKKFATLHPEFENAGMMFDKETLEPLYKLTIGKSEDSNALFISKKMGIKNRVLDRAKEYVIDRNYNLDLVKRSKLQSNIEDKNSSEVILNYTDYNVGDKVKLLDEDDFGIVYKPMDKFNNVEVLFNDNFISVNIKRLQLSIKASELYPEGYDLDVLFTSFKERKLEKDIQRGSKKALKKIQKEIRENRK